VIEQLGLAAQIQSSLASDLVARAAYDKLLEFELPRPRDRRAGDENADENAATGTREADDENASDRLIDDDAGTAADGTTQAAFLVSELGLPALCSLLRSLSCFGLAASPTAATVAQVLMERLPHLAPADVVEPLMVCLERTVTVDALGLAPVVVGAGGDPSTGTGTGRGAEELSRAMSKMSVAASPSSAATTVVAAAAAAMDRMRSGEASRFVQAVANALWKQSESARGASLLLEALVPRMHARLAQLRPEHVVTLGNAVARLHRHGSMEHWQRARFNNIEALLESIDQRVGSFADRVPLPPLQRFVERCHRTGVAMPLLEARLRVLLAHDANAVAAIEASRVMLRERLEQRQRRRRGEAQVAGGGQEADGTAGGDGAAATAGATAGAAATAAYTARRTRGGIMEVLRAVGTFEGPVTAEEIAAAQSPDLQSVHIKRLIAQIASMDTVHLARVVSRLPLHNPASEAVLIASLERAETLTAHLEAAASAIGPTSISLDSVMALSPLHRAIVLAQRTCARAAVAHETRLHRLLDRGYAVTAAALRGVDARAVPLGWAVHVAGALRPHEGPCPIPSAEVLFRALLPLLHLKVTSLGAEPVDFQIRCLSQLGLLPGPHGGQLLVAALAAPGVWATVTSAQPNPAQAVGLLVGLCGSSAPQHRALFASVAGALMATEGKNVAFEVPLHGIAELTAAMDAGHVVHTSFTAFLGAAVAGVGEATVKSALPARDPVTFAATAHALARLGVKELSHLERAAEPALQPRTPQPAIVAQAVAALAVGGPESSLIDMGSHRLRAATNAMPVAPGAVPSTASLAAAALRLLVPAVGQMLRVAEQGEQTTAAVSGVATPMRTAVDAAPPVQLALTAVLDALVSAGATGTGSTTNAFATLAPLLRAGDPDFAVAARTACSVAAVCQRLQAAPFNTVYASQRGALLDRLTAALAASDAPAHATFQRFAGGRSGLVRDTKSATALGAVRREVFVSAWVALCCEALPAVVVALPGPIPPALLTAMLEVLTVLAVESAACQQVVSCSPDAVAPLLTAVTRVLISPEGRIATAQFATRTGRDIKASCAALVAAVAEAAAPAMAPARAVDAACAAAVILRSQELLSAPVASSGAATSGPANNERVLGRAGVHVPRLLARIEAHATSLPANARNRLIGAGILQGDPSVAGVAGPRSTELGTQAAATPHGPATGRTPRTGGPANACFVGTLDGAAVPTVDVSSTAASSVAPAPAGPIFEAATVAAAPPAVDSPAVDAAKKRPAAAKIRRRAVSTPLKAKKKSFRSLGKPSKAVTKSRAGKSKKALSVKRRK
jgi:hypothetical protein